MQVANYRTAGYELLAQAKAELAAGDVRQASEKGWGAAAQMVKAVAEHRTLPHQTQGALYQVVDAIVQETGGTQILGLFRTAGFLHTNFYENWATYPFVEDGLREIETLARKLDALLE